MNDFTKDCFVASPPMTALTIFQMADEYLDIEDAVRLLRVDRKASENDLKHRHTFNVLADRAFELHTAIHRRMESKTMNEVHAWIQSRR
jgi:hypothetical protein